MDWSGGGTFTEMSMSPMSGLSMAGARLRARLVRGHMMSLGLWSHPSEPQDQLSLPLVSLKDVNC